MKDSRFLRYLSTIAITTSLCVDLQSCPAMRSRKGKLDKGCGWTGLSKVEMGVELEESPAGALKA